MSTPNTPMNEPSAQPQPASSEPAKPASATMEQSSKADEVEIEITDIKASGLPAKVGFFSGLFYVRVKGGKVPQRTKTARYTKEDEFVARWGDTVKLSGLESSKVEIEVYARRFFFSYKIIKKTESKESLADLLEHSETPIELELLEEGQAAGKLIFKIGRSPGGAPKIEIPPATAGTTSDPEPQADSASVPETPKRSP